MNDYFVIKQLLNKLRLSEVIQLISFVRTDDDEKGFKYLSEKVN